MSELEPSAWLGSLVEILEGQGAQWAVAGAIAANVYRVETRITTDLDLLVEDRPPWLRHYVGPPGRSFLCRTVGRRMASVRPVGAGPSTSGGSQG
jgi:hypothetical protein